MRMDSRTSNIFEPTRVFLLISSEVQNYVHYIPGRGIKNTKPWKSFYTHLPATAVVFLCVIYIYISTQPPKPLPFVKLFEAEEATSTTPRSAYLLKHHDLRKTVRFFGCQEWSQLNTRGNPSENGDLRITSSHLYMPWKKLCKWPF